MIYRVSFIFVIAVCLTILWSCSKGNGDPVPPDKTEGVSRIEDVLNGDDRPLIDLLNNVRGSIGKRGPGSKTVWSRKNDFGLGIYLSANHLIGLDTWQTRGEKFIDIRMVNNGIFETSQLPPLNGSWQLGDILSADFLLYHSDISERATNTTILPEEDFYIGIVDNQKTVGQLVAQRPDLVQIGQPLEMYDPSNRTTAAQTWGTSVAGEKAILVGYPRDASSYPNGAVVYGTILTDAEAQAAVNALKQAGDSEGNIPYEPEVEFFVAGSAIQGMSGGGAFNSSGQCLGIMVRASDTQGAPRITRVIKTTYIRQKLVNYYNTLPQSDQDKFGPFVNGEL